MKFPQRFTINTMSSEGISDTHTHTHTHTHKEWEPYSNTPP